MVRYDDGEVEAINLAAETVKWPREDAPAAANDKDGSKKRRVVVAAEEESESEESEFDFGAGKKTPGGLASAAARGAEGGRKSVQSKGQGGSASGDGGAVKRAR